VFLEPLNDPDVRQTERTTAFEHETNFGMIRRARGGLR
jgi:hypothetical protein